jgi:hypothetical protein
MAKTIGQLTQATTLASGDEFVIEQSGLTKRVAASVVRGGLVNADIDAAAAIAHTKLANITAGQVLLGNASNVPTATALTGDVTVSNTGVTSIAANAVVTADIADGAVTTAKLADYEEGTWTPSLGGTATYTSQAGVYVKIGKLVFIKFVLQVNTIGTGSATTISGLPFTASSTAVNRDYIPCGFFSAMNQSMASLAFFANGTTLSNSFVPAAGGISVTDTGAIFKNSAYVIAAGCYRAA